MKNIFYKNLFQSLSFFLSIMVLEICLLSGFFISLNYENNYGWILIILSLFLFVIYFLVGFYWIFQKVIFNENGIKIVLINKIISEHKWNEIKTIKKINIMRNPALKIILNDGSEIHLDERKSIIKVIEKYIKIE